MFLHNNHQPKVSLKRSFGETFPFNGLKYDENQPRKRMCVLDDTLKNGSNNNTCNERVLLFFFFVFNF